MLVASVWYKKSSESAKLTAGQSGIITNCESQLRPYLIYIYRRWEAISFSIYFHPLTMDFASA